MRQLKATQQCLGAAGVVLFLLAGNAALLWPVLSSNSFRPLVMPISLALLPMLVALQVWQFAWSAGVWKRRRFGISDLLVLLTGHAVLLVFLRLLWSHALSRF